MSDLLTTFTFVLEIDSVEVGSFRKVSGIESETETIEYKEVNKDGKMIIRKQPGAMKWSDITLERRIDVSQVLWNWRKEIIQGDVDKGRRNGAILAKDSKGETVARWEFVAGWPSKWSGADFDAGANDIATEKVVITHEGLVRVK
ncbi:MULTISPECIES: phage tail protein [Streptomyces]|jgi:phage tail-like protein|uniref:Phage tail-like protein n=1 Tax=Streptomyces echinatus TaxID=67293 RepID=A0A7W9URR9_9ACTN|nr:phage tail protein [Streptomyces echinatus]MBB5928276.1 phage tail-like protein [Streptomyces echinatus]